MQLGLQFLKHSDMFTKRVFTMAAALMIASAALAQNIHYEGNSVTVLEPGANISTSPIIADQKICGERFTETVVLDQFPAIRKNLRYVDDFQVLALAKLAKEHNADFIITTQVNVCTQDGCFAVTVTGYPARYENFRQPTDEDMNMLWKAKAPGYGYMFGHDGEDAYTSRSRSLYAGLLEIPYFNVKPGFQQMLDLTFVPTDDLAFELEYSAGYRFTNSFFLGAGAGVAYSDWNESAYIPVFVNSTFYLTRRRVAPTLGLRLGINASLANDLDNSPVTALVDFRPGIRVHTNSGKDINVTLSLGSRPDIYNNGLGDKQMDTFIKGGLSVGFTF